MGMPIKPQMMALSMIGALGLVASACSSSTPQPKHAASTTSAPSTSQASTTSSVPASTTTTVNPGSAVAGGCIPAQLAVTLAQSGVAAGSVIDVIALRNTSATSCTLRGYAGVQPLDQVGHPVTIQLNRTGSPLSTVSMAPGATAAFQLQFSDGTGFSSPQCAKVTSLQVTPPNDFAPLTLGVQLSACGPSGSPPQMSVTPVTTASASS
jgi:hypothetical protein